MDPIMTIEKGTTDKYFSVQRTEDIRATKYPTGPYVFIPNSNGTCSLRYADSNAYIFQNLFPAQLINGETDTPFATIEEVDDYCTTNFFPNATGGGGGGIIGTVENNEFDFSKYYSATWAPTEDADLTFINEPAGNYDIIIYVTNNGYNLTILGQALESNPSGLTRWTVTKIDGTYNLTTDAAASSPVITLQPLSQTINEGEDIGLTVNYTANPAATVQWQKGGVDISGATSKAYSKSNAVSGDSGAYRAKVQNTEGTVYSNAATVTVNTVGPTLSPLTPPDDLNPNVVKVGTTYTAVDDAGVMFKEFLPIGVSGFVKSSLDPSKNQPLFGFSSEDMNKLIWCTIDGHGGYYSGNISIDGYGGTYALTLIGEVTDLRIVATKGGGNSIFTMDTSTDNGVTWDPLLDEDSNPFSFNRTDEKWIVYSYFNGGRTLINPQQYNLTL